MDYLFEEMLLYLSPQPLLLFEYQAMRQDRDRQRLYIVRKNILTAVQRRQGLPGPHQAEGATGTGAKAQ